MTETAKTREVKEQNRKRRMKEIASEKKVQEAKEQGMVIEAENLYRSYKRTDPDEEKEGTEIQVLRGINLEVYEGDYVGIMGKSGCGKTTLIKTLGMLDAPTLGTVYFKGQNTKDLWENELADIRRRDIGFVFQDFYLMDSLSVKENIMLPMILDKRKVKSCLKKADRLAERFGLTHLMSKNPYELSGGEKQRVAICRALINNPEIILADEPTGNLDSKSGDVVVKEFQKINRELGKTILMVTHDPQVASNCRRIIFLKDGVILETLERTGGQEKFYQEILKRMKLL